MKRQIAVLALLSCVACYSADPSVGTCNVAADCKLPDGGPFLGATYTAPGGNVVERFLKLVAAGDEVIAVPMRARRSVEAQKRA